MKVSGKTITLYLLDEDAEGRWKGTLKNWDVNAYKIPREKLGSSDTLEHIEKPGVYFLFWHDNTKSKPSLYVGETHNVLKRLKQHCRKYPWEDSIVFVTVNSLDSGQREKLEARILTLANKAKRYNVANTITPTEKDLIDSEEHDLKVFINNASLFLFTLGHPVFTPLRPQTSGQVKNTLSKKKDKEKGLLYFSHNQGKWRAIGKWTSDAFCLLKGSLVSSNVYPSAPQRIKELREKYAEHISQDGLLEKNIVFKSLSYAAAFVRGARGKPADWKYEDGTPSTDVTASKKERPASSAVSKKSTAAPAQGQNSDEEIIFRFKSKKVIATGRLSGNGFIVFKGSAIRPDERNSCAEYIREKRKKLIETRKIKDNVFVEDTSFESPAEATVVINGGGESANRMWIADGKKLGDFRENAPQRKK